MRIGIGKKNHITRHRKFFENIKAKETYFFLLRSYNAHIIVDSEGNAFRYHVLHICISNMRECIVNISIRLGKKFRNIMRGGCD